MLITTTYRRHNLGRVSEGATKRCPLATGNLVHEVMEAAMKHIPRDHTRQNVLVAVHSECQLRGIPVGQDRGMVTGAILSALGYGS